MPLFLLFFSNGCSSPWLYSGTSSVGRSKGNKRPDFHGSKCCTTRSLASVLALPVGSSFDWIWDTESALLTISLRAACRWCLPQSPCNWGHAHNQSWAVLALAGSSHKGPQSKTYCNPNSIVVHARGLEQTVGKPSTIHLTHW